MISPTWVLKLKPAVPKNWLHITAGIMWSGVGIFLNLLASDWVKPVGPKFGTVIVLCGALLAFGIYRFGFSNLAEKNIQRVEDYLVPKVCWFAFQKWSSYPLVALMISLGIYLRKYSPIPKPYLAVLYIGIGASLFFASLHYYGHVLKKNRIK